MFYDELKKHCAERGISTTVLALEIGVSTKDTIDWERGVKPPPEVIEKIAAFFGESKGTLFPRLKFVDSGELLKMPDEILQQHPEEIFELANYKIEALGMRLDSNERKALEVKDILSKLSVLCDGLSDNHKEDFRALIASAIKSIDEIRGAW